MKTLVVAGLACWFLGDQMAPLLRVLAKHAENLHTLVRELPVAEIAPMTERQLDMAVSAAKPVLEQVSLKDALPLAGEKLEVAFQAAQGLMAGTSSGSGVGFASRQATPRGSSSASLDEPSVSE